MNGLRLVGMVLILAAAAAAEPLHAQIRIIDRARIDSLAAPQRASGAEAMRFERTETETGVLSEDDAPTLYEYRFANTGGEPIVVTRITATCGCTTAEAEPKIIPAGGEGCIRVAYDPRGHVGRFTRRIFVYTQLSEQLPTAVLTLTATVTANEERSTEYPFAMGALRLRRNEVHFVRGESAAESIEVFNAGGGPLTIGCRSEMLPPHVSFGGEVMIPPHESRDIEIRYDASAETVQRAAERGVFIPLMLTGTGLTPMQSTIKITIDGQ